MPHSLLPVALLLILIAPGFMSPPPETNTSREANTDTDKNPRESIPSNTQEARSRAILLHDTFEIMLHTIHHEYYREDEGLKLPAATFRDVFDDLSKRHHVRFHWLAVDGQAMNIEHKPADDFEREAARRLSAGQVEHERIAEGQYSRAGRITLTSECLKCHVPDRKSTADRTAGLVITLPLAP